jgi:hypothetical protein
LFCIASSGLACQDDFTNGGDHRNRKTRSYKAIEKRLSTTSLS